MPIPILKGLRRAGGPQPEVPRNPNQGSKTPSPRANVRAAAAAAATTSGPTSSIPALQGNTLRVPRGSPATRSPRIASKIGVQSPRPPPRVSSVVASPKPASRSIPARENDNKIKIAQAKRTDTYGEGNFSSPNSLPLASNCTNSNRSSVISNGSSVPPPSSSSSNRNSNSSISSNFSISSWNSNAGDITEEPPQFVAGGSDTFPRASGLRRSFNVPGSLTSSVNVDTRASGRSSIQRPSQNPRSTKGGRVVGKTSSSESSIALTRSFEELSPTNHSDSNLAASRLKVDSTSAKSSPITSVKLPSNRNLLKPSSVTRGAAKNICNYSGHSYLPATNRSADPNANKTRLGQQHPANALRSPSRSQKLNKTRTGGLSFARTGEGASSSSGAKVALDSSDEEDDGYSSVANNDQPDEEVKKDRADENDYDEVEEEESLEDIQPMKPLEGLSRYSYVLGADPHSRVASNDLSLNTSCEGPPSDASSANNIPILPEPRTLSRGGLRTPSKQRLSADGNSEENLKFDCLSPRLLRPSGAAAKRCIVASATLSPRPRLKEGKSAKKSNTSSDSNMSAFDDSILDISYKNFVKDTKPPAGKETYSWEVRNSIGDSVPSSRRKVGLTCESGSGALTSPSLPALGSTPEGASNSQSAPPSRPNSLTSPGKLQFSRGSYSSANLNSNFYRTGSLRSPKEDPSLNERKVTYPFSRVPPSAPQGTSPTSTFTGPFARNSPKYSTVIPRTLKQSQNSSYPFPHSLSEIQGGGSDGGQGESHEEVEKLRKDLASANEKIFSLTEQLNSSNKLVAAYEHSLSNMTQRLQQLTKVAEQKDSETFELRRLLERSCMDSSSGSDSRTSTLRSAMHRSSSIESMTSLASNASFTSAISSSSAISFGSNSTTADKAIKKKNWLRSSFSKAFKRREKRKRSDILPPNSANRRSPLDLDSLLTQSDTEGIRGFCSLPSSPLPQRCSSAQKLHETLSDVDSASDNAELTIHGLKDEVARMRKALQNKDSVLTESRLDNLSSAHQIDALKESVHRLSAELSSMRSRKELFSESDDMFSLAEKSRPCSVIKLDSPRVTADGKAVAVYVRRSDHKSMDFETAPCEFIGDVTVRGRTSWDELDNLIQNSFDSHLSFLDPKGRLSLDADAVLSYRVGEIKRAPMLDAPELLPYGYLVGEVESIEVNLQTSSLNSVDAMAFETLISKSHLQRFISFLKEQRRVILTGPQGVGKSFLANRLADFVVQRLGIEPSIGNIAKFNVDEKTPHDLHVYLSQLSDLCEAKSTDLPLVLILESLEKIEKLSELFAASLRVPHDQCPFIIGTLRISAGRTSLLKIPPSFRLIPLDPTQDPVSNILPRLCRRYVRTARAQNLDSLFEWLCRCLSLLNHVLDSSGVDTFGPATLLPLPSSLNGGQLWFHELWKAVLLPRLQEAAQNVSLASRDLKSWQDLDKCLREELPWEPNTEDVSLPQLSSME